MTVRKKEESFKRYVDSELSFRATHRKKITLLVVGVIGVSGYGSFKIAQIEAVPGIIRLVLAVWSLISFFVVLGYVSEKLYPGGLSMKDRLFWRGWFG